MNNKQENICAKYGITHEELVEAVKNYSAIATSKFAGNTFCLLAILDLLYYGDIEETIHKIPR